jgi:hypothetical protein
MTYQSSEVLKVGDETLYIRQVLPLEYYFPNHENTALKYWNLTAISTSENRGYHGIWTIKNNSLYLTSIDAYRKKVEGFLFWKKVSSQAVTISELFPNAINDELKATWFTGKISAYTKSMRNPIDDQLSVRFEKGNLVDYQWYHLEGDKNKTPIPYDRPLG